MRTPSMLFIVDLGVPSLPRNDDAPMQPNRPISKQTSDNLSELVDVALVDYSKIIAAEQSSRIRHLLGEIDEERFAFEQQTSKALVCVWLKVAHVLVLATEIGRIHQDDKRIAKLRTLCQEL